MYIFLYLCAMIKTRYERIQSGSAMNFPSMWVTLCSARVPCVATPLLKHFFGHWAFHCSLFWPKHLMSLMMIIIIFNDDDGDDDGDGDVDDVGSLGDNAEICWKNIVVPSRAASPKPSSRSRIVTWSLSDFMSLETYPRDHTCSGTPQYPRRYMKSIQLGNTPHDPFKLYNLFFFAHVSSF